MARQEVFTKFSVWCKQIPASVIEQGSLAVLSAATKYILSSADNLSTAHKQLETFQHAQVVSRKTDRFRELRELYPFFAGAGKTASLTDKNNVVLYKR